MENGQEKIPLHQNAKPKIFEFAHQNRAINTPAEKAIWEALRLKKLDGFKFRNQHPIGRYVADFYCHSAKLVVEIDGGYHQEQSQKEYDLGREHDLSLTGIKVIRFTNEEVLNNLELVLEVIRDSLKGRIGPVMPTT